MQPFIAAMSKLRQAFFAAIVRSLLRTKSLLQTILNIWISPSVIKGENVDASANGGASTSVRNGRGMGRDDFLEMVDKAFRPSTSRKRLGELSEGFRKQFLESMEENPLCMLPSYNHQLPSGDERGTFLALDVGGSTFRVALIELPGRDDGAGQEGRVLKRATFKINNGVRQLKGVLFFDWMAERIEETLSGQAGGSGMSDAPLSMGLAWSFPIE
jgi:hexokinase